MGKAKWLLVLAGVAIIVLGVCGAGYERETYSCHVTRSWKTVQRRTVFFIPLPQTVTFEHENPLPPGETYHWWRYSTYRERGLFGLFGKAADVQPYRFRDGGEVPVEQTAANRD